MNKVIYNVVIETPDKRDTQREGLLFDRAVSTCCENGEEAIKESQQWVRDLISKGEYVPIKSPVLIRLTMFCEVNT